MSDRPHTPKVIILQSVSASTAYEGVDTLTMNFGWLRGQPIVADYWSYCQNDSFEINVDSNDASRDTIYHKIFPHSSKQQYVRYCIERYHTHIKSKQAKWISINLETSARHRINNCAAHKTHNKSLQGGKSANLETVTGQAKVNTAAPEAEA